MGEKQLSHVWASTSFFVDVDASVVCGREIYNDDVFNKDLKNVCLIGLSQTHISVIEAIAGFIECQDQTFMAEPFS